jgi:thioredoxin-related protein
MSKNILILLLSFSALSVQAQSITFEHGTFIEAIKKAQKEDKLIFVDVYTDWCGPCKLLDQKIFSKPEVGTVFNKHFISLKINAEKGDGIEFAKEFNVSMYPTLLFLDKNGFMVHSDVGYMPASDLLKNVETVLKLTHEN